MNRPITPLNPGKEIRMNARHRAEAAIHVTDDGLVVAHCLFKTTPADRGMAVVDVYRIEAGMLAKH
jgi:hypothetical protein